MFDVMKTVQLLAASVLLMSWSCLGQAAMVDGEELIDPTAPFLLNMTSTGSQPIANLLAGVNNFAVSSVLIRENLRIAVINSQRVREGEFVGNARVVSIDESGVTIDLDGETRILKLHGTQIKSRADD